MTLSFALESIPKLNIVCIAHGMVNFDPDRINEGESCKFNLVWSLSQKSFFKDDINHASFVLGLPYEVYPPQSQCREVILVGHCGMLEDTVQYFNSLYYFCKIYQTLEAAGIKVFYRPHPQDDIEFVRSIFPNVYITEKSELLASNRKIFIGFSSSLMFEAQEFGHNTIGLDFDLLEFNPTRTFDIDFEVHVDNFDNLPDLILEIFEKPMLADLDKCENLKFRFNRCLQQIDEFNVTDKSDSLIV